jgi:acetyl/propionyl-CoA carboxylase alpha subunit
MIGSLLIANRGEVAVRIARAAAELGIRTVAVHSTDDARSLHVRRADLAIALPQSGPPAYLNVAQLICVAMDTHCDAIHPGYGFLSESAEFAAACRQADLRFVGPRTELLELFGDKARARALARKLNIPVPLGTFAATSRDEAHDFFRSLEAGERMVIKALAGGGGRGMRVVAHETEIAECYARCQSEAAAAFGNSAVYVERYSPRVRHIEVQIVGDGSGAVSHLWERECTLQRRHQKLIEIAPSPTLAATVRSSAIEAALRMAREVRFDNLGTFEFLVDADDAQSAPVFIEANARLQVEHTVTEEILGIDLVKTQIRLAAGASLADLGLQQDSIPRPRAMALQLRVNMEVMQPDGSVKPTGGTLSAFSPPGGPGVRIDTFAHNGYTTTPSFDSLLAKVIVCAPSGRFEDVIARAQRALREFDIAGVATNRDLLATVLRHPDVLAGRMHTRFIDEHAHELVAVDQVAASSVDANDVGAVHAPIQGTIVAVDIKPGDTVRQGQQTFVMEAMKMEHIVAAACGGVVRSVDVVIGDAVAEGAVLARIEISDPGETNAPVEAAVDPTQVRRDLREAIDRHERTLDAARPAAVARRRENNQRTARENIADLCDPDTFVEYGPLALAAQRARRSLEELIEKSPADGMVTGVGRINGQLFEEPASRAVVMAYDYTVFAGTQGTRNHIKTDRMIQVARSSGMPVVLFAEGGGGRPGDSESSGDAGGVPTFGHFAELSGLVPLVGIVSGRCFAGNASLVGCCDVIIATANSNLGMGGPAMIEGGGLGVFTPEQIGPVSEQLANGVIDIGVRDEAEAVQVAKTYLSYFQGPISEYESSDQLTMRQIVPANRLRVYDVRRVIGTLSDVGWTLELRREFGKGMITALIRVEGRSVGIVANDPKFLGGAIDSDGADKAARFMQLCDAHGIPILFLCDTPGIMVGPEAEKTALVRHSSRMFLIGASLSVPTFAIVLRKAYGLGALAMAGGSFKRPLFTVAWPTGEFGGMGLEGAVKLAYRNELAQIADPAERRRKYDELVARMYEHGKALSISTIFGVDDTIDPADSRKWLAGLLRSIRPPPRPPGKRRPVIDAW